ncbi:MAG TPA: DUF1501 domain-containing protein [Gemmataceae bacterium]|jgi:hypothetical protein|nr:DUF1501 domain-containing protein [Gemmataceae bacterium]
MLNRRDAMMRLGQIGLGGLTLPQLLAARESATLRHEPTADACIFVFLWGGPPQQDLWDMKPDAPAGIKSQFDVIDSVVPGIRVSDHMPLFAQQTDKTCIVRSLSHGSNNHEPSVYHMMTGRTNPTLAVPRNQRNRRDFPFFGSVVSHFNPPQAMPATVTIPRPIGHDGVTYSGTYSGFLGPRHDPFEQTAANYSQQQAAHPTTPLPDLALSRLQARHGLLKLIEEQDRHLQSGKVGGDLDEVRGQAMQMMTSDSVRKAFALDREAEAVRNRYGRDEYGESFLLARRLVEAGVKVVTIAWMKVAKNGKAYNVWDNHGGTDAFDKITGYAMLKEQYCLPGLDRGLSALLADLSDRGMLKRTLVAAVGEFGRTPKINGNLGRDHWGACQSAVLAGGGVKGGQVYGSSDKIAAYPKDNPVSPEDFLATIYHALGLPPEAEVPDREGRPHRIVEGGKPVLSLFA